MKTYREPERNVPVVADVDVLVVGAGPAGAPAAIAAARAGAETMVVEVGPCAGGMWTLAMMAHATSFHDGEKVIVGGIAREILDRLADMGGAIDPVTDLRETPGRYWAPFDPDMMRCVLDDMLTESGARVRYHTRCVGAIAEDNAARGILMESKSGREAVRAKATIDCTGDADVAHFAGAETVCGREADGRCQPMSTTFFMGNVDTDRLVRWREEDRDAHEQLVAKARAGGEIPDIVGALRVGTPALRPGTRYHNVTRVLNTIAINADDLTRAEIEGRRQVRQAVAFYRKHIPGFEEAVLLAIAPQVGLRETRRIVGEYALTAEDVLEPRHFPDGVARHRYYIDVHNPDGQGHDAATPNHGKVCPKGTHYEVPYRCMVPRSLDGLLAAGRCISATREGLGSMRTTVCCAELGEAAGVAAAWATRDGIALRDVDGPALKRALLG